MSHEDLPEQDQYRLVYTAIAAVAAHCDGAVAEDFQGFNGQDTKFGRRIASVPFESWTPDVCIEAARISLTYKEQILRYTGIDVSTLPVVREARGLGTNHAARDQARTYERQAKGASKKDERKVLFMGGPKNVVRIGWVKGDPDFQALLDEVRALPGRNFAGNGWDVPATRRVAELVAKWDIPCDDRAGALLEDLLAQPERVFYNVNYLKDENKLSITAPYNANRIQEARQLPGRYWTGEYDRVDITPRVVEFARKWGLTISPEAQQALDGLSTAAHAFQAVEDAKARRAALLREISKASDPNNLPDEFVALLQEALA